MRELSKSSIAIDSNSPAGVGHREATRRLRIASVTTVYPNAERPEFGVFVQRRLTAVAAHANLQVLNPIPWFPIVRPARLHEGSYPTENTRCRDRSEEFIPTLRRRMFYIPKFFKHLDGQWLCRAITNDLRRLCDADAIDLIDAHFGYPEGVGCVRTARLLGIPVFVTLRGVESSQFEDPRIGIQMTDALRSCDGVIAVSTSLKECAVRHGVPSDIISVIPNTVDRSVFLVKDRQGARRRLGLPPNERIVVSVGQLIRRKGHHILVDAMESVRRSHPNTRLVIVGGESHEPNYPQQLRRQIHRLGLDKVIQLTGSVPPSQVAEWLNAADLFAMASSREGCCNAVLESLACGVPVVTTHVGDNSIYIRSGKNGWLAPVGDSGEFAGLINRGLQKRWDRSKISLGIAEESWDEIGRATIDFFETKLSLRQASRKD